VSDAPRVSVIIPVYNAGEYLAQALASVAAQTWRDHETVVVDDGSTDPRTRAILQQASSHPGVHVHRTENRGPSHARNLAIERARGTYILPLDADDYLAPDFLARTVPILDAEADVGIVHTWVGLVGRHRGVWRTGEFSVVALLTRCTLHVASLYRRQVWTDVGGYDPRFVDSCEDWDFWLSAAERGWGARCVPEVLTYYRRTRASRELRSRTPEASTRIMRSLVAKHRPVYEEHVDEAMGGMYARLGEAGLMIERFYAHPAVGLALRLRDLLRRTPAS
jgi:glycosyltransferase involved in cell wall biosynthesis